MTPPPAPVVEEVDDDDFVPPRLLPRWQMNGQHTPGGDMLLARTNVLLASGAHVYADEERWRLCCVPPASRSSVTGECLWTFAPERMLSACPPDDARYRIMMELVETEEAYGESMGLVASTLIAPLQRPDVAILPAMLIAKIFSSTDRIASVSRAISSSLRPQLAGSAYEPETAPLGAVLLACLRSQDGLLGGAKFADAHVQYVNNFEQSQRALDAAEKAHPEWRSFLKHWHLLLPAVGKGSVQLSDLLIRPVQRVPRLKLLLEQLVKETPPDHPDRAASERALEELSKIASAVNEAIRRREAVEAVFTMQQKDFPTGTELVRPGRYLVRRLDETSVGWPPIASGGGGKANGGKPKHSKLIQLTLVLFSDALLLCERSTLPGASKLGVFHWFLPTGAQGGRPGEATGTLHVTRAGSETLTFVVPEAEQEAWLESLQHVSAAIQSGGTGVPLDRAASSMASPRPLPRLSSFAPSRSLSRSKAEHKQAQAEHAADHAAASAAGAGKGTGVLAGWLRKKGGGGADGEKRNWAKGGRRSWKKRWVVVTNSMFRRPSIHTAPTSRLLPPPGAPPFPCMVHVPLTCSSVTCSSVGARISSVSSIHQLVCRRQV